MAPALVVVFFVSVVAGSMGVICGVGGGFLIVPLLRMMGEPPTRAVSMSLFVVLLNGVVGSVLSHLRGDLDLKVGVTFAGGGALGAAVGVWLAPLVPVRLFDMVFCLLLAGLAVHVWRRPCRSGASKQAVNGLVGGDVGRRKLNYPVGVGCSVGVGILSSVLGIGGGVVHVPIMVGLLGFRPRMAAATSCFVIACAALVGLSSYAARAHLAGRYVVPLLLGALVGGALGGTVGKRVPEHLVMRVLAVLLCITALRAGLYTCF